MVREAEPWIRARLLASRIADDQTRADVTAAINVICPYTPAEVERMTYDGQMGDYDWAGAQAAVAQATEVIGRRLRETGRRTRWRLL